MDSKDAPLLATAVGQAAPAPAPALAPTQTQVQYQMNSPLGLGAARVTMTSSVVNSGETQRGDYGWYERNPRRIICQYCGIEVITATRPVVGTGTHLIAIGTCCIGCIPCCLIPYCMDGLKDVEHSCPNCHRMVGAKRLM